MKDESVFEVIFKSQKIYTRIIKPNGIIKTGASNSRFGMVLLEGETAANSKSQFQKCLLVCRQNGTYFSKN